MRHKVPIGLLRVVSLVETTNENVVVAPMVVSSVVRIVTSLESVLRTSKVIKTGAIEPDLLQWIQQIEFHNRQKSKPFVFYHQSP